MDGCPLMVGTQLNEEGRTVLLTYWSGGLMLRLSPETHGGHWPPRMCNQRWLGSFPQWRHSAHVPIAGWGVLPGDHLGSSISGHRCLTTKFQNVTKGGQNRSETPPAIPNPMPWGGSHMLQVVWKMCVLKKSGCVRAGLCAYAPCWWARIGWLVFGLISTSWKVSRLYHTCAT